MASEHARSGDIVDLSPLGARLHELPSHAVVRDERLEVMRLSLPAGKTLPEHRCYGPCTLHCLEGEVMVQVEGQERALREGELLYLAGGVPHAVDARRDSSLLVTMVLVGCTTAPDDDAPPGGEPRHGTRS